MEKCERHVIHLDEFLHLMGMLPTSGVDSKCIVARKCKPELFNLVCIIVGLSQEN